MRGALGYFARCEEERVAGFVKRIESLELRAFREQLPLFVEKVFQKAHQPSFSIIVKTSRK